MPKFLDITNQRFGKLVALYKLPSRKGKTYWMCQCDCGNQKEVQTGHLTSGNIKSCGCQKITNIQNNIQIECLICGQQFISNNYSRKYCYQCSPKGKTPTEQLRYKKRAIKQQLIYYKGGKCEICGYNKCQAALEFHHINPLEKEFQLSYIDINGTTVTMDTLKKEVDKCLLVCANCHAEIHYLKE